MPHGSPSWSFVPPLSPVGDKSGQGGATKRQKQDPPSKNGGWGTRKSKEEQIPGAPPSARPRCGGHPTKSQTGMPPGRRRYEKARKADPSPHPNTRKIGACWGPRSPSPVSRHPGELPRDDNPGAVAAAEKCRCCAARALGGPRAGGRAPPGSPPSRAANSHREMACDNRGAFG